MPVTLIMVMMNMKVKFLCFLLIFRGGWQSGGNYKSLGRFIYSSDTTNKCCECRRLVFCQVTSINHKFTPLIHSVS